MKVTLNLDKLLNEGKLTQAEYDKFLQLLTHTVSHFCYYLMLIFGVVVISVAAIFFVCPWHVGLCVAVFFVICFFGAGLSRLFPDRLEPLATIILFFGAFTFGLVVILEGRGSFTSLLALAIVWGAAGILARSVLLISLSVFALASCLGGRWESMDIKYFIVPQEPLSTVLLFTPFTILMFWLEKRLPLQYRMLALAAGLSGLFLVNLGFWVGSLWGGHLVIGKTEFFTTLLFMFNMKARYGSRGLFVSPWLFVIAWGIALAVTGYWAYRHKWRWLFALVATFGAINFYTQWFKYVINSLEAPARTISPTSPEEQFWWIRFLESPIIILLIGGLLGIAYALAFRSLNSRMKTEG